MENLNEYTILENCEKYRKINRYWKCRMNYFNLCYEYN